MIELNLLPKELRIKKRTQKTGGLPFPVMPVASLLVITALTISITVVAIERSRSGRLAALQEEWKGLEPLKQEFDATTQGIRDHEKALEYIKEMARPKTNWFLLMKGLSEAITPGVWLTRLNLEAHGRAFNYRDPEEYPTRLVLTGHVIGSSEVATAGVARFISSLKEVPEFSANFKEIELVDMRSQELNGEDTMLFRLKCEFRDTGPEPAPREEVRTGRRRR